MQRNKLKRNEASVSWEESHRTDPSLRIHFTLELNFWSSVLYDKTDKIIFSLHPPSYPDQGLRQYEIKVISNATGHMIGHNNTPVVLQGDALFHIGIGKWNLSFEFRVGWKGNFNTISSYKIDYRNAVIFYLGDEKNCCIA